MKKLLVVVDMQNDFIDGALGTKEALAIVPNVVKKIKSWDGDIVTTQDTHSENYMNTREGRHLPVPHCILGTNGWEINREVTDALNGHAAVLLKNSFGAFSLVDYIRDKGLYDYVEFVGVCTDICVVSCCTIVKNAFPEMDVAVDSSCCAGVTPESHNAALLTMKMCQVEVL